MNKTSLSLALDKLGICTSFMCMAHCVATPLLVLIGFDTALRLVGAHWLETALLSTALILGLLSFYLGYARHRQHHIPVLFIAGFLLVVNAEVIPTRWASLGISAAGAVILVYAHFQNLVWKRRMTRPQTI